MAYTWPVVLGSGDVELSPLGREDRRAHVALRRRNASHLGPWEAKDPNGPAAVPFRLLRRNLEKQAVAGTAVPLAIRYRGRLAGQVTASPIQRGAAWTATIGYWVDRDLTGQGLATCAVAMLADFCFEDVGLHRLELSIRPENAASLRVAEKLRFRYEGIRRRLLYVDGDWRDHEVFALTVEEIPVGGLLARLRDASDPARFPA